MNKKIILLVILMLISTFSVGCDKKEASDYKLYYIDIDVTKLMPQDYKATSTTNKEEIVKKLLTCLREKPNIKEARRTIPNEVKINKISLSSGLLVIDFNKKYRKLSTTEEVLCRAGIVRTLLQVNGINKVKFTINGDELLDLSGEVIGYMDEESFVDNPGEQINSIMTEQITLYFANKNGNRLEKETRVVHYSSNISKEKLIMEQLLKGPDKKGALSTIPKGTQLINISISDGVCYVNLDETFKNQNYEITEPVVIYSIVNSLSQIDEVSKVQISINGDTSGNYRYSYALSKMYAPDYSLIASKKED
ncbi:GerMN domain-containing protein [Lachnobacterium bovis]|uniref:Germination protein M n=1 Tax=Lachnobacterium bovis TaxID=140626 RepID=A0A1H9RET1_9FIRM|nr:GerMN domain-containing protein [Lachnobacterium bovis]SER71228.1 germination protein M [Lachnobacterium bovis]